MTTIGNFLRIFLMGSFALFISFNASAQSDFSYPVIKNYGGVADFEKAILPKEGAKILIDLTSAATIKDGANKSLDKIARLINLYKLAGIDGKELELAVIFHGEATKTVLSDKAYNEKYGRTNPDTQLIKILKENGVKFMVCGQAIAHRGFKVDHISPEVDLALSAITILVEYQQKGFAVLYF
ncbi:MAG: DsrE family protein [Bacteroidota bacterium]